MDKIKILVVEDELVVSMMIEELLIDFGYDVLAPVTNYQDAIELLNFKSPDIAILDIQIQGEKTGIDLARYINDNFQIPFIFLTSQADVRTIDSVKELCPSAYLVKPFTGDNLFATIELAVYNYGSIESNTKRTKLNNKSIKDFIFVKSQNTFQKVKFSDIIFIKSEHVYLQIYTKSGIQHLIRSTMEDFLFSLSQNFLCIHRSYIINLEYLGSIKGNSVLVGEYEVPLSRSKRSTLLQRVKIHNQ